MRPNAGPDPPGATLSPQTKSQTITYRGVDVTVTPSEWKVEVPSVRRGTQEQIRLFLVDAIGPVALAELISGGANIYALRGLLLALKVSRWTLAKVEALSV